MSGWPEMLGYHAALAQEPWGYDPERLVRVTFAQARRLYVQPAVERADRLRAEAGGDSPARAGEGGGVDGTKLPDREAFVSGMQSQFPNAKTREQWEADWAKLKGQFEAKENRDG